MADERIQIDDADLRRLEQVGNDLAETSRRLDVSVFADVIGELEQAVANVLGNLEAFGRFFGLDARRTEDRETLQAMEQALLTLQGGLTGADRGFMHSLLVSNPYAKAAIFLSHFGAGTYLGATEFGRRQEAQAALYDVQGDRIKRDQRLERETAEQLREINERRDARTRALFGGSQ